MANYPDILPAPTRDNYQGAYAIQQIFEGWVEYTLNGGVEYVDIPYGDGTVRCRPVDGKPVYTPVGAGWSVSMAFDELRTAPAAWSGPATWPSTLPVFEKSDFQVVPTKGATYSDIETGNPEVRLRFRTRVTTYSGKVLLSPEQRETFWTFYRDRTVDGVAHFNAPFANGMASALVRARIVESPVETPEGSHFWIRLSLETTEAPLISLQDYNDAVAVFINTYCDTDYVVDGYVGYWEIGT